MDDVPHGPATRDGVSVRYGPPAAPSRLQLLADDAGMSGDEFRAWLRDEVERRAKASSCGHLSATRPEAQRIIPHG
jgi:hypothetical protein